MLVVPERSGDGALRSIEARLDEAAGLAAAIGIDVVERKSFRLRQVRPASLFGKGQAEEIADIARTDDLTLLLVDTVLTPVQQKNLEQMTKCKVIDRTGLILEIFGERAATAEGPLAGRAGASRLSGRAAGAQLDPSRAPARRLRLPRRPGRNPDRGRSADDPRPHGADPQGTRPGQAHARAAPRAAPEGAVAAGRAGRLHQCRQVDAVQPHDRGLGDGRGSAVRDARPDHAAGQIAGLRQGDPVGHGRVRVRLADRTGRGVPRHARGSRRRPTSSSTSATARTPTATRRRPTSRPCSPASGSTSRTRRRGSKCGTRSTAWTAPSATRCSARRRGATMSSRCRR